MKKIAIVIIILLALVSCAPADDNENQDDGFYPTPFSIKLVSMQYERLEGSGYRLVWDSCGEGVTYRVMQGDATFDTTKDTQYSFYARNPGDYVHSVTSWDGDCVSNQMIVRVE